MYICINDFIMRNLFLIPIFFVVTNVFSQKYDLNSHPLKSDVWVSSYVDSVTEFKPKEFKSFSFDFLYVTTNIDPEKVQEYLYESFNQFRTDYGLNKVEEDPTLTISSISHSKTLFVNYKHSQRKSITFSEAIAIIPFNMLSRVTEKDGDINKIIADSCFDIFVGCPSHMSILLNENPNRQYGFGITVKNGFISIVIQGDVK